MPQINVFRERLVILVDEYEGAAYLREYQMSKECGILQLVLDRIKCKTGISFLNTTQDQVAMHPELLEKDNPHWVKLNFKDIWRIHFNVSSTSNEVVITILHSPNSIPKHVGTLTWTSSHVVMFAWESYLRNQGEQ